MQTYYLDKQKLITSATQPGPALSEDEVALIKAALEGNQGKMTRGFLKDAGLGHREARDLLEDWRARGWLEKDASRGNAHVITPKLCDLMPNCPTCPTLPNPPNPAKPCQTGRLTIITAFQATIGGFETMKTVTIEQWERLTIEVEKQPDGPPLIRIEGVLHPAQAAQVCDAWPRRPALPLQRCTSTTR